MSKKVLALMLGAAVTAAAVTGCSSKPKETEAVTEAKTEKTVQEAVTEAQEDLAEAASEASAIVEEAVSEAASDAGALVSVPAELEEMSEALIEEAEAVSEAVSEAAAQAEEAVSEAAEEALEAISEAATEAETKEPGSYKVGIVKFVDHASLNQIEDSLKAQLDVLAEETGATFDYEDYTYNGNADGSQLQQIGAELVSEDVDVIVAIATPAAQVLQAATEDADIPIIFSAVTDPVGANLVASNEQPGGNLTGTSDALNTETMMNLIFAADEDADKIGLLYSNSEDASKLPIEEAKAYLDEKGVAYVEKTGTTTDEVNQAVDALIAEDVDAIFTPTDNTIMNAELAIFEKLQDAKIPHYAGADSFALNGAFLGFGVNYVDLGIETANLVEDLLVNDKTPDQIPVVTFDSGIATINTETADALGLDLETVKKAFAPYCSEIIETTTAENFSDVEEEAVTEAVTE